MYDTAEAWIFPAPDDESSGSLAFNITAVALAIVTAFAF